METKDNIKKLITKALEKLDISGADFAVEYPENPENGDYSTNVAMVYAQKLRMNPRELAEKIVATILPMQVKEYAMADIKVAGSGFINFYLPRAYFAGSLEEILNNKNFSKNSLMQGKKVMLEYTDPNPFKPFHIGHLMTNVIGESISRILENSGAEVFRANYQGDVGMHVARAIWGLLKNATLQDKSGTLIEQSINIGKAYALGADAYETDENSKAEINVINKKVYDRSDAEINSIYDWGFKVTMEAFEDLYKVLGTKFDYYFLESQMAPIGERIVKEHIGKVFSESDGAIVFKAEDYDPKLHTRVFITSQGLPTYETKELGLTVEKFATLPKMDASIVVTALEQADYMRVVAKALSIIHPEYESKMRHITHGMLRFASGKMSSRKGNVVTGESLIRDVRASILERIKERGFSREESEEVASKVGVAALKYSILKQSIGGDIIYDFDKSISFEGDSGPYLQYSYARAYSVLEKAKQENILPEFSVLPEQTFEVEKLLSRFHSVVLRASQEGEPHHITNYLIEVARAYNSFYGNNLIADKSDRTAPYKVALTFAFTFVLKRGLYLLGIETPEKM
ncbi:MAG: arginine--tRNA ligase [Candidatus Paceibacterota bacterium]